MTDPLPSTIPHLTMANFNVNCGSLKNYTKGVAIVLFYSGTCSYCRQVIPEYTDLANRIGGNVSVLGMNIGSGTNNQIGFYQGEPCSIYGGVRTADAMESYVNKITSTQQCPVLATWKSC
jgi:thiol-disulfide isomerase/thioredoxin